MEAHEVELSKRRDLKREPSRLVGRGRFEPKVEAVLIIKGHHSHRDLDQIVVGITYAALNQLLRDPNALHTNTYLQLPPRVNMRFSTIQGITLALVGLTKAQTCGIDLVDVRPAIFHPVLFKNHVFNNFFRSLRT